MPRSSQVLLWRRTAQPRVDSEAVGVTWTIPIFHGELDVTRDAHILNSHLHWLHQAQRQLHMKRGIGSNWQSTCDIFHAG